MPRIVFELPFYFPSTHTTWQGYGNCFSPTRIFFLILSRCSWLILSSAQHRQKSRLKKRWNFGSVPIYLDAHVFVFLITKYVAIYCTVLYYVSHVFMLATRNIIQDFDTKRATACVVEGKRIFCVCGDDSQLWWWFTHKACSLNISTQFYPFRRRRFDAMRYALCDVLSASQTFVFN